MPLPKPHKNETRQDWMDRCMGHPTMVSDFADTPQRAAVCSQIWRDRKKDTVMMNRAYSFLEIKAVDSEKRIITGIATTPTPDRMKDIVEPLGVEFKNPMPLLWQHRTSEPVGTVSFDKPTKKGITFRAQMPKVEEPGKLKDRIDEAWQSVKLGLVKAVSIGFRAIESSFMDNGGIRYAQSEVLELSLVTIPAQADATIETIKSIDARDIALNAKANSLNGTGRSYANSLIASGNVDKSGAWSFSSDDGNKLLGPNGDDWTNYGKHFLGVDSTADSKTKAHWKYPFAKGGTLYRSALTAIRQRAGQQGDDAIFAAAGTMITKIDGSKSKDMGGGMDMSMTYPASDESQMNFMTRCVSSMLNCYEDMTQAEATAHCAINWDNRIAAAQAAVSNVSVKSVSAAAASGRAKGTQSPGVAGRSPTRNKVMKTFAEQIASLEAARAAKDARMKAMLAETADSGTTFDSEQTEEYDGLEQEVKAIDDHLVRLRRQEEQAKKTAVAVTADTGGTTERASAVRAGVRVEVIRPKLEPGIRFTRMVGALCEAKGNRHEAAQIAASKWSDSSPEVEMALRLPLDIIEKTAVAPGTTTGTTWAEPLVQYTNMAGEFIEFLRPLTVIGRITGFRRVPFKVKIPRQTAGASVNWVGETKVKPLSSLAFDSLTLDFFKIAGIIPLSEELIRFSSPSAEMLVRDDLANAIVQLMDTDFLDPTKALAAGVSPASITNGVTPTVATGTTAAAFRADVKTMMSTFLAAGLPVSSGVWIMKQGRALALSLMMNTLGQPEFPNISMTGGTLLGFPVVVSENVPAQGGSPADGDLIIFALAGEILLADDGGVTIDVSREASLQMETTPDSPATASTTLVSLWQHNMVAIKAERFVNWLKRRSTAVAFISSAKYSA